MRAFAVPEGSTALTEMQLPTPVPQGTEVLLRVTRSGVCHTDTHLRAGYYDLGRRGKLRLTDRGIPYPLTMGHEVVGLVEAAGPDAEGVETGSTRLVYPWIGCGECGACLAGRENACPKGRNLGVARPGGYADHLLVPHPRYLLDIGDLDPSWAAIMACSGLTAYGAVSKVLPLPPDAPVVVTGTGGRRADGGRHAPRPGPSSDLRSGQGGSEPGRGPRAGRLDDRGRHGRGPGRCRARRDGRARGRRHRLRQQRADGVGSLRCALQGRDHGPGRALRRRAHHPDGPARAEDDHGPGQLRRDAAGARRSAGAGQAGRRPADPAHRRGAQPQGRHRLPRPARSRRSGRPHRSERRVKWPDTRPSTRPPVRWSRSSTPCPTPRRSARWRGRTRRSGHGGGPTSPTGRRSSGASPTATASTPTSWPP